MAETVEQKRKLRTVGSMHEQREYNWNIIPLKGDWVEAGDFVRLTEQFDCKARYECVERTIDDGNGVIIVKLHKKNLVLLEKNKQVVIDELMEKFGDKMVASYLAMFGKGMHNDRHILKDKKKRLDAAIKLIELHGSKEKAKLADGIDYTVKSIEKQTLNIKNLHRRLHKLKTEWRDKYEKEDS